MKILLVPAALTFGHLAPPRAIALASDRTDLWARPPFVSCSKPAQYNSGQASRFPFIRSEENIMDPVTITITAIAMGAAAEFNSTTEQVVKDAYTDLKTLMLRKYPQAGDDLALIEAAPYSQACRQGLTEDLEKAGAAKDEELSQQAKALLDAVGRVSTMFSAYDGISLGADILGNLGVAYHDMGDAHAAIGFLELMVYVDDEISDYRCEVNLLHDAHKTIEYYEQSLAIDRELGDRRAESVALVHLGIAYRSQSNAHKAIAYYEQALAIDRELGDRYAECRDLGNLGLAYADLNKECKAIEFYEQFFAISREIGQRRSAGHAMHNTRAHPNEAIAHAERYLKIYRDCGDSENESYVLDNIGQTYAQLGDMLKAIDYLDDARCVAHANGDRENEYDALINLGHLFTNLGDMHKATDFYQEALWLAHVCIRRQDEYDVLGILGKAYTDLRYWDKVIDVYEKYLKLSLDVSRRHDEGNVWGSLGLAYADSNNVHKAIVCYEQALAIDRKTSDRQAEYQVLGNLTTAYKNLEEAGKVIACYEQQLAVAREIGDRQAEASTSWEMGKECVRQGDIPRGISLLQTRVDYEREIGHPDAERHAQGVQALRAKLAGKGND